MSDSDNLEVTEPETAPDEYVARLAECRRRLTILYKNLISLNDLMEESQAVRDPASQNRH